MKKRLIFWVLLCVCIFSSQAQEEFRHKIEGVATRTCSPYFFVKSNNPKSSWMPLNSTRAEVQITGVIANVKVEQVYVNNSKQKLDAMYIFPGSTNAAVYGMDMKVGKRTILAEIMEKEKARKNFENARNEGKSATLLEQDRPNIFKMEVANILPGDTVKVALFYTELLEYKDKDYEFVYPTAVGPRYSTTNEEFVNKSIEQLMSGHKPEFNIHVTIDGAIPVQTVESSTHQIKINKKSDYSTEIMLSNQAEVPHGKDFILNYGLQGGKVETGLTLYEHNDEKFFLLMMQPPKIVTESEILPREYIFIVDVSGSMSGYPLEVSKTILKKLILSLKPTDRFNVLLFESGQAMLSDVSLPATAENVENAIFIIDNQHGYGGTNLYKALQSAFDYKDPELKGYARTFIIATDGFVTVESKALQLISNNIIQANFFPLGIGDTVNRYLIEGMAWAGAAEPFIINNKTEAEKTGERLINTISSPLLTNINADWGSFEAYDIYPQQIPDVFSDRPVIIYGKYKGNATGTILIKGITAKGTFNHQISVKNATKSKNEALRYLWARNKLKYLSDYADWFDKDIQVYIESRKTVNHKSEIVELGLKYNLLTDYTSFLAVDENPVNKNSDDFTVLTSDECTEKKDYSISHVANESPAESQVFIHVEQMPAFPGGNSAVMEYINSNMKYPLAAQEQGIQGTVVVRFKIDKTGNVTDVEVIRSLDPFCDAEAVRIVKSMPKWIPGKQAGRTVDTYYTVPIRFKLNS